MARQLNPAVAALFVPELRAPARPRRRVECRSQAGFVDKPAEERKPREVSIDLLAGGLGADWHAG
jgi:hypothetical protein